MTWLREKSPFIAVSFVLGLLMVLFLLVPIISSVASSVPGLPAAITDTQTLSAIWTSFYCAFIATAFVFILGIPFAYMFVRNEFRGKKILDSLIDIPILIPHNTAGIALLAIIGPASVLGSALESVGIGFVDTIWGIIIAMAFVSAPFMIRSAQEAFLSIDPNMEKTGRSLGATKFRFFTTVTLPLSTRGILTGCLLTWARAVSEFGAVILLAYFPRTAPVYVYDVLVIHGLDAALPINGVLILISILVLVVFRIIVAKPTKTIGERRKSDA